MIRNEELLSILLTALDALHLLTDERFSTPELMFENCALLSETIQEIIISQRRSTGWSYSRSLNCLST